MKKTLLLVFSAAILLCASSAKAQTIGTDAQSTTTQTEGTGLVHPLLGGEWSVGILVTDSKSNPISGALVTAPCTGQSAQYTNSTGTATFSGVGTCPCSSSPVNVTTSKCNQNVHASCGTTLVICP